MSAEDPVITARSLGYLAASRKVQMSQRLKKSAITSIDTRIQVCSTQFYPSVVDIIIKKCSTSAAKN